jgi:hypothetical protein
VVDAQVAADADQPGLEVGAAVEGVERLEQLEEDVLRQVLGLVVLADELVGDVEHAPAMLLDDRFPRLLVAGQAALDQLIDGGDGQAGIGLGHVVAAGVAARRRTAATITKTGLERQRCRGMHRRVP